MDKKTLLDFIAKAHRHTFAAPSEIRKLYKCAVPILPSHKDYDFVDGDFRYHDSYAGSSWAPGREVVFFKEILFGVCLIRVRIIKNLINLFMTTKFFLF